MITCKEDLMKGYVKNEPALKAAFIELALKLGFEDQCDVASKDTPQPFIIIGEGSRVNVGLNAVGETYLKGRKELTLADLTTKPRTKVTYEKVTESIFDLKAEFAAGALYFCHGLNNELFGVLDGEEGFAYAHYKGLIYRRVVTEVTERDEFIDAVELMFNHLEDREMVTAMGVDMFDSGKFQLTEGE